MTCRCLIHIHDLLTEDSWKPQVLSCHAELPDAPIFLWIPPDEWIIADHKLAPGMMSSIEAEHHHFQDARRGDGDVDMSRDTVVDVWMETFLLNTA